MFEKIIEEVASSNVVMIRKNEDGKIVRAFNIYFIRKSNDVHTTAYVWRYIIIDSTLTPAAI